MYRRTRLATLVIGIVFAFCAAPVPAMEVDINFLIGGKTLDEDDWGKAHSQGAFGVTTTFGKTEWPVFVALDYVFSSHAEDFPLSRPPYDVELVSSTFEFGFGVRKIWKVGNARPYVGAGFGVIGAMREVYAGSLSPDNDVNGTLGAWLNGGTFWRLGKKFNIGVDLRFSTGEVTLFREDVQVGGTTWGLLLGWGWGPAVRAVRAARCRRIRW